MKTAFIISITLLVNSALAMTKIDDHHVINPECNSSIDAFEGMVGEYNHERESVLNVEQIEEIVMNWISSNEAGAYLKFFDSEKFYWQVVDPGVSSSNNYIGLNLIIPENQILSGFYTQLGGGLYIPGVRAINQHMPWINNGEIISFVVDIKTQEVVVHNNWRFNRDPLEENEDAYFIDLELNFSNSRDKKKTRIEHYVNREMLASYDSKDVSEIKIPVQRTSMLVFYQGDKVVGLICYDLRNIKTKCPMDYAVQLHFDGETDPARALYCKPQCTDKYRFSFLRNEVDDELVQLQDWISSEFFGYQDYQSFVNTSENIRIQ